VFRLAGHRPAEERSTELAEPDFIVSVAPALRALVQGLERELPEARVLVGPAGTTMIAIIAAEDAGITGALATQFPRTALLVVNVLGHTPPAEVTAHLEAGATGFIDGAATALVAAHIGAIARRQAQAAAPGSKQTRRSF
jgi:hypothetical protein